MDFGGSLEKPTGIKEVPSLKDLVSEVLSSLMNIEVQIQRIPRVRRALLPVCRSDIQSFARGSRNDVSISLTNVADYINRSKSGTWSKDVVMGCYYSCH